MWDYQQIQQLEGGENFDDFQQDVSSHNDEEWRAKAWMNLSYGIFDMDT